MRLLSLFERVELGQCPPQPNLGRCRLDEIYRDEMIVSKRRFDDEVRERTSNRIDDHSRQLSTRTIATHNFAPDRERRGFAHERCLSSGCPLPRSSSPVTWQSASPR